MWRRQVWRKYKTQIMNTWNHERLNRDLTAHDLEWIILVRTRVNVRSFKERESKLTGRQQVCQAETSHAPSCLQACREAHGGGDGERTELLLLWFFRPAWSSRFCPNITSLAPPASFIHKGIWLVMESMESLDQQEAGKINLSNLCHCILQLK